MIVLFNRAGGSAIPVYHSSLTAGQLVDLCNSGAASSSTAITNANSTSFQIGSGQATGTYDYFVLQEIAGFSYVGDALGNASSDGTFSWENLAPGFMLMRNSTLGGYDWAVWDSVSEPYNVRYKILRTNANSSEYIGGHEYDIDFVSNGAKIRSTYAGINGSGNKMIIVSIADSQFKYATAG